MVKVPADAGATAGGLVVLLVLSAAMACGQADIAGEDPDTDEAWEDLQASGLPPTRIDLEESEIVRRSPDPAGDRTTVLMRWRAGLQDDRWDHRAGWRIRSRRLDIKATVRWRPDTPAAEAGAVVIRTGPGRLAWGDLGLGHGFGLLAGRPGRGASLSPDQHVATIGRDWTGWSGQADRRSWRGVAAGWRSGSLTGQALAGISGGTAAGGVRAARLIWSPTAGQCSLMGLNAPGGRGVSLALSTATDAWRLALESARWKGRTGGAGGGIVTALEWRPKRGWACEVVHGASTGPSPLLLASRPAVLSGWEGDGYAVRVQLRPMRGFDLQGLVHRARHRERGAALRNVRRTVTDLVLDQRPAGAVRLSIRLRRTVESKRAWSDRYPWTPAEPVAYRTRTVASARLLSETGGHRASLLMRTLLVNGSPGGNSRTLVGATYRRTRPGSWGWRAAWILAWGDPVDLVSAAVPMPGFVVPRHWGSWNEELLLGWSGTLGGQVMSVGASLRRPEVPESPPTTGLWLASEARW